MKVARCEVRALQRRVGRPEKVGRWAHGYISADKNEERRDDVGLRFLLYEGFFYSLWIRKVREGM